MILLLRQITSVGLNLFCKPFLKFTCIHENEAIRMLLIKTNKLRYNLYIGGKSMFGLEQ